jgi:hypothetical protein
LALALSMPALVRALIFWASTLAKDESSARWPAPGSADTELGVLMEPEVSHGATKVYAGVQA